MDLRQQIRNLWEKQSQTDSSIEVDLDLALDYVLSDPERTKAAVSYFVKIVAHGQVSRFARARLLGSAATKSGHLADQLIEHGLTLLDAYFGRLKLGDYLPDDLLRYAHVQRESGQTQLVQAAFAKAVALACPSPTRVVREQVSPDRMEQIRKRVIEAIPDKSIGEEALRIAR